MVRDVHGLGTLVPEDPSGFRPSSTARSANPQPVRRRGQIPTPSFWFSPIPKWKPTPTITRWRAKTSRSQLTRTSRGKAAKSDLRRTIAGCHHAGRSSRRRKSYLEIGEKLFAEHLDSELNAKLAIAKWEQAVSQFSDAGETEARHHEAIGRRADARIPARPDRKSCVRHGSSKRSRWILLTIRAGIMGRMQGDDPRRSGSVKPPRRARESGPAMES